MSSCLHRSLAMPLLRSLVFPQQAIAINMPLLTELSPRQVVTHGGLDELRHFLPDEEQTRSRRIIGAEVVRNVRHVRWHGVAEDDGPHGCRSRHVWRAEDEVGLAGATWEGHFNLFAWQELGLAEP